MPNELGHVTAKAFSQCSVDEMRRALQRKCRPASSKPVPGRVPGKSLYPAYVQNLAAKAMRKAALEEKSATHVTRHARRKVARAKRAAKEQGREVAAVLEEVGMHPEDIATLGAGTTLHEAEPVDTLRTAADTSAEAQQRLALTQRVVNALGRLEPTQRYVLKGLAGLRRKEAASPRTLAAELRMTTRGVLEAEAAGLRALRAALEPTTRASTPKPRCPEQLRPPSAHRPRSTGSLGPLFSEGRSE